MRSKWFAILAVVAVPMVLAALQGCATNPARGGRTFTGGLSTAEEIRIGRDSYPQIIAQFGGEYGSPTLRKYVDSIGQFLAQTSERHDLTYKFTILNSDMVNAFAMPGGYIYVSRGLLALADNEAQLAAVLAHELGHITALHHAERHGQGMLANLLLTGAGILAGVAAPSAQRGVMQAGQGGLSAVLSSFSRENEFEADDLGLRYMIRARYDPFAMSSFLRKLRNHSRLEAKLRGQSPDKIDKSNYLATHPAPLERVDRAARRASATKLPGPSAPIVGQDTYLSKIDGILYGADPKGVIIDGRIFTHPVSRFRFEAPEGFRLINSPKSVIGIGPQGSQFIFDRARKPGRGPLSNYLTQIWARNTRLDDIQSITINGMDAATGTARVSGRGGAIDLRLVAIRYDSRTIYRFLFLTRPNLTRRLSLPLRRATYSFRRLSEDEARNIQVQRISVIRTRKGDSQNSLARRMDIPKLRIERLRTLNGLGPSDRLMPERPIKLIQSRPIARRTQGS
ncbi:MAG: M48 family metalloprotease [Rhodospirillales bacterium]|nr:M48 family metalloprotease [Rhodospirillales bacterium]